MAQGIPIGFAGPGAFRQADAGNPEAGRVGVGVEDVGVEGAAQACQGFPLCGPNSDVLPAAVHVQLTHRVLAFLVVVHLAAVSNDPMGSAYEAVTLDVNCRAGVELYGFPKWVADISLQQERQRATLHFELGRFLSPDPVVQVPEYSQNFNRYSYVLNNPLMLIDPTGYLSFGSIFKAVVAVFVAVFVPRAWPKSAGSPVGPVTPRSMSRSSGCR